MNITLTIDKNRTLADVARVTSYTGAKQIESDPAAYDRISTVEADAPQLLEFWRQARDRFCNAMRRLIEAETDTDETYTVTLALSASYDSALTSSMQSALDAYFVYAIIARWYVYTNRGEAADYDRLSTETLADIRQKALCKRRPQRPSY